MGKLLYFQKSVICKGLLFVVLFLFCGFFVKPLRNFLLSPIWPRAWEHLSSFEVIMIERHPHAIPLVKNLEYCPFKVFTNVSFEDAQLKHANPSTKVPLKHESHRRFLPTLNETEKRQILHLYMVMAEALNNYDVQFFFMRGSLLGVFRHQGLIPWDDDVDITISVSEWPRVRDILSCIQGYRLDTTIKMHWKFHPTGKGFPFIDIFFYAENDYLGFAITRYTARQLAFTLTDVFPLSSAPFENTRAPVPRNMEKIIHQEFDTSECRSPSINHKSGQTFPVLSVPCSSLGYLFDMKTTT